MTILAKTKQKSTGRINQKTGKLVLNWVDVNVLEEVVPHEGVVALWVVSRKACGAMAVLSYARLSQSLPPKDVRIPPDPQRHFQGRAYQGGWGPSPSTPSHSG